MIFRGGRVKFLKYESSIEAIDPSLRVRKKLKFEFKNTNTSLKIGTIGIPI